MARQQVPQSGNSAPPVIVNCVWAPVIFGESGTRDRLTTSHPDFDSPGDDAVFTRVVDDAQVTVMKGKCDRFLLTAIQVQDDRLPSAIDSLQELLSGPGCSTEGRESESQYRTHEDFALRT